MSNLESIISQFSSITLAEMDRVALMNRTDTKFVIRHDQLPAILEQVISHYSILEVEGQRLSQYHSRYFDTSELKFYHDHHRGRAGRIKVRIRTYAEVGLSFLEVKRKDKKGDTIKKRIPVDGFLTNFTDEQKRFLEEANGQPYTLNPSIENSFKRITLVNNLEEERLTIDTELTFNDKRLFSDKNGDLVIIEVKQSGLQRKSPIMQVLKALSIRPYKVSKYCLGMASLNPSLKRNRFKQKFLKIDKIIK